MKKPSLTVLGKEYPMPKITPLFFREMTELETVEQEAETIADIVDSRVRLLSTVFGIAEETIKKEVDIADVTTAYRGVIDYISAAVTGKVEEIPNAETVEEKAST